ncbi:MAG: hypothetical protein RL208_713 [Pseudomonadota bacterium]|jgi:tRNA pseudouridine38-40 synthase
MWKYKAVVEYYGMGYAGMQRQVGQKTIQGELEIALSKFADCESEIDFCGRTDAGVHAFGQVVHFVLKKERDCNSVLRGLNFYLQDEKIAVKSVELVDDGFHCRFDARKRFYVYKILNSGTPSPLHHNLAYRVPYELDLVKMQLAANLLVGRRVDFSSFCSNECQAPSKERTIDRIEVVRNGDLIEVHYEAKSFLHNMVRILTGTLLDVARGRFDVEDVERILQAKDRTKAGQTVPPFGLYFMKVEY